MKLAGRRPGSSKCRNPLAFVVMAKSLSVATSGQKTTGDFIFCGGVERGCEWVAVVVVGRWGREILEFCSVSSRPLGIVS
jgi:hypothetical protein